MMTREDYVIERSIENREFQRTVNGQIGWRETLPMSDSKKDALRKALAELDTIWNKRVSKNS